MKKKSLVLASLLLTATALAKRCKVSRPTIYLWLKEDKEKQLKEA